jgi:hypothetical protein
VGGEIGEGDGKDAFGYNNAWWSKALERIFGPDGFIRHKFDEDVGGEDLCERTKPQNRILGWKLMRTRRGLAISAKKDLIAPHHDKNHAGRTGLREEIRTKGTCGLQVRSLE